MSIVRMELRLEVRLGRRRVKDISIAGSSCQASLCGFLSMFISYAGGIAIVRSMTAGLWCLMGEDVSTCEGLLEVVLVWYSQAS